MSPSDVTMQLKPALPHEFCSRIGSVASVSFGARRSRICRYASARTLAVSKPPAPPPPPPSKPPPPARPPPRPEQAPLPRFRRQLRRQLLPVRRFVVSGGARIGL